MPTGTNTRRMNTVTSKSCSPHDAGSADCQIYDQLSHADGVGFGVVEPGAMPPAQPPAPAPQAPQVAAQAAGYLARGPPTTA